MVDFKPELINRAIKYFQLKYNRDISIETAEEYLNSLADLYGCFIEFLEKDETN